MKIPAILILSMTILLFNTNMLNGQIIDVSNKISKQVNLNIKRSDLKFPKSVKHFYAQHKLQLQWINKSQEKQAFDAMMLVDCVLQYGLVHKDYHPEMLTYDNLNMMVNDPQNKSIDQRIQFDIMLTDALITLINHLHYGKLSPNFPTKKIDRKNKSKDFSAVQILAKAYSENDIIAAIIDVQPNLKEYKDLQSYMRLVKGQYVGDCYQIPESKIKKIAINMERLRWWAFGKMNAKQKKAAYLTCEIKDGLPVFTSDYLNLDPTLEDVLYLLQP